MAKTNNYRGGNSRLLAKSLDGLGEALAVIDVRGTVVFANEALCRLANADATELVGKICSWNLPSDDTPHAAILTALAPPQAALEGRFATRRLTTPVVFGSTATGQVFLPILDRDGLANLTLVVFGDWEAIREQMPSKSVTIDRKADQLLVALRSRWQHLDGLEALIGRECRVFAISNLILMSQV